MTSGQRERGHLTMIFFILIALGLHIILNSGSPRRFTRDYIEIEMFVIKNISIHLKE